MINCRDVNKMSWNFLIRFSFLKGQLEWIDWLICVTDAGGWDRWLPQRGLQKVLQSHRHILPLHQPREVATKYQVHLYFFPHLLKGVKIETVDAFKIWKRATKIALFFCLFSEIVCSQQSCCNNLHRSKNWTGRAEDQGGGEEETAAGCTGGICAAVLRGQNHCPCCSEPLYFNIAK